jgi:hypothetical protein
MSKRKFTLPVRDEPPKPISLATIGRGKHMTVAAKSAMLRELKDLGYIPEDQAISERPFVRARQEAATRRTPFGPLMIHKESQNCKRVKYVPSPEPTGNAIHRNV